MIKRMRFTFLALAYPTTVVEEPLTLGISGFMDLVKEV